jgi:Family of unknown function (DUF6010)
MIPLLIGISSGLILILLFSVLKQYDKKVIYGLILSGIGFLYVGYAWTDLHALLINSAQAVFFLLIAYYGVKKNLYIMAAGYFLHGTWDLVYHLFSDPNLIPPHYDLFCFSIDFIIGLYLVLIQYRTANKPVVLSPVIKS